MWSSVFEIKYYCPSLQGISLLIAIPSKLIYFMKYSISRPRTSRLPLVLHSSHFCFLSFFLMWDVFGINTLCNDVEGNFIRLEKELKKPRFTEMPKTPICITYDQCIYWRIVLPPHLELTWSYHIQRVKWTQNIFLTSCTVVCSWKLFSEVKLLNQCSHALDFMKKYIEVFWFKVSRAC